MKISSHLANGVIVLSLFAGLLILSSCSTDVQQKEKQISLKGEKVTAKYMQEINNSANSSSEQTGNSFELYEVNTNSPEAKVVEQKLASILNDSLSESSKNTINMSAPPEPTRHEPEMDEAYIREDSETGQQALVTPINDGVDTRREVTVSGYNESTNSIEKSIVVTVQGNYTAAEVVANPQLADQAELDITFQAETGEILFSHTFTAQNYNNMSAAKAAVTTSSCYWDCMISGGGLNGWLFGYTSTLGGIAGTFASSNVVGALLGASAAIGVHTGCFYGCLASWLWYDVLGM